MCRMSVGCWVCAEVVGRSRADVCCCCCRMFFLRMSAKAELTRPRHHAAEAVHDSTISRWRNQVLNGRDLTCTQNSQRRPKPIAISNIVTPGAAEATQARAPAPASAGRDPSCAPARCRSWWGSHNSAEARDVRCGGSMAGSPAHRRRVPPSPQSAAEAGFTARVNSKSVFAGRFRRPRSGSGKPSSARRSKPTCAAPACT